MLVRPARCCQSQSIHSAARVCLSGSRGSRAWRKTLASTKHGAVIEVFALGRVHGLAGKRKSLAGAPGAVRGVVDVAVTQLAAQHFADVPREAHAPLRRV